MITLLDFKIWESYGAVVIIHLSWWTFVTSQSLVLYSRLNLVLLREEIGRYVFYVIVGNAIIFGLGTVVLGMVAVSFEILGYLFKSLIVPSVILVWSKGSAG